MEKKRKGVERKFSHRIVCQNHIPFTLIFIKAVLIMDIEYVDIVGDFHIPRWLI